MPYLAESDPDLQNDVEFDELMARYVRPAVLVMGRGSEGAEPVSGALRSAGYDVLTCGGPGRGICPLMLGERCPLRELVDAALVFVDGRVPQGALPKLTCAAQGPSPAVVALEGKFTSLRIQGRQAVIGAKVSVEALAGAVELVRRMDDLSQEAI
ncbi:MAG: hypothetical protein ACLGHL_05165 [Actinomycetota bacterium]